MKVDTRNANVTHLDIISLLRKVSLLQKSKQFGKFIVNTKVTPITDN